MKLSDFICQSNASLEKDRLKDTFQGYISVLGLDNFMMGEISSHSTLEREEKLGISTYPAEWMDHYMASHYIDHDPVYRILMSSPGPVSWEEIQRGWISKIERRVMGEAGEFGLRGGIGLAIWLSPGRLVGFGFSSPEKRFALQRDSLSLLSAAAFHFCGLYYALSDKAEPGHKSTELTERERQVLNLLALGLSRSLAAELLSVSVSCVKRHCENSFLKLGAANIPSAVARAIRSGQISPF